MGSLKLLLPIAPILAIITVLLVSGCVAPPDITGGAVGGPCTTDADCDLLEFCIDGVCETTPPEPELPGFVSGEGTTFSITDSEYFNVTLTSSEVITLNLISAPEIIDMVISSDATSAVLTISNMQPSTAYYMYTNDFHNLENFTTDSSGSYTWTQAIPSPATHVWIQTGTSTYFIRDDPTGGDCVSKGIGTWDPVTKTCTLTTTVTCPPIQIDSNGVTLDCAGAPIYWMPHPSCPSPPATKISVYLKQDVTIKNCNLAVGPPSTSPYGIVLSHTTNSKVLNTAISNSITYGIFQAVSSSNTLANNTISNNPFGIYLVGSSNSNTLINNTISNSVAFGIQFMGSSSNTLANNTFTNNRMGIHMMPASNSNTFEYNTISGSTWFGIDIMFGNSFNTFSYNTISDNNLGVFIEGASDTTINYNNITGNNEGIIIMHGSDTTINYNSIYGNTGIELGMGGPITNTDVTNNWWGSDPPNCAKIQLQPPYSCPGSLSPWLTAPWPVQDSDGDGINDDVDNCVNEYNPDQADTDNDCTDPTHDPNNCGDICEICPDDPDDACDPGLAGTSGGEYIIASDGGTVATADGGASFTVPAGALANDTSMAITYSPPEDPNVYIGRNWGQAVVMYSFTPKGATFSQPVTITLVAECLESARKCSSQKIIVYNESAKDWEILETTPTQLNSLWQLTAETWHFTNFGLAIPTDSDGDEIFDYWFGEVDDCPNGYGYPEFNGCTAGIAVQADKHTVGTGTHPGSTKEPLAGLEVKLYDKSAGSCVQDYGVSWQNYADIVANCTPLVTKSTDSSGYVLLGAVPGDYLIIGDDGTDKHLGVSASDLTAGTIMRKYLQQIIKADGSKVGGKTTKKTGSEILIIEPEYIIWDNTTETYPFLFVSLSSWGVDVTVTPPEGYVSDYDSLTETTPEYKAVQFTLTEVGSVPDDVGVRMQLRDPRGRSHIYRSQIVARLTEVLAKAKGLAIDKNGVVTGKAKGLL